MPTDPDPSRLPQQFGRYRIDRPLGQGGMGEVYLAYDVLLDRAVALKVLRAELMDRPEVRERFVREARAAAMLWHPNLCPVFDLGEWDDRSYLVMAYIEGRPLSDYLRDGPWPQERAAALVHKLACAMAYAHGKQVLHRDLKPSNVILNTNNEPIITDFGLARLPRQEGSRLTMSGAPLGTPGYMAPEQFRGDPATGPTSDIYSLGVILYETLVGRPPFVGSVAEVFDQVLHTPPAPPSQYRPGLDPRLDAICLKALAKRPEDRFARMEDFAQALAGILRHPQALPATPPSQRGGCGIAAFLLAVLAAAVFLVWLPPRVLPALPWEAIALLAALPAVGLLAWLLCQLLPRLGRVLASRRRAAPPTDWKPPPVVGGYRLGELLGRGGSAEVYRGEHVVLGSPAALKILRHNAALPPSRLQRALREAALVARLKHPHIVPVLNAGQEADFFFVVMEHVPGGDVARLVPDGRGLPLPRALAIARDVAGALHYVHRHGLVHRDVKPSNVLLDGDGRALLSDFGSVKQLHDEEAGRLTAEGEVVGTAAYMAPEQALGQPVTPAADLYGFGCLLHFLVTGQDVFRGNALALLAQQIHAPPPGLRAAAPHAPGELEALVLDLLRKKPEERPGDMEEVLRRLDAIPLDGRAARAGPEPEALVTLAGLPGGRDPRADETLFGAGVVAVGLGGLSSVQTIVPLGPGPARAAAPVRVRAADEGGAGDEAGRAWRRWQHLRETDAAAAERFWLGLPEGVRSAPALAVAREWQGQRQADRLFEKALDCRRQDRPADAVRLLREALAVAPGHAEAGGLLRELEAAPVAPLDLLQALARDGKPQRVPALAAVLRARLPAKELDDYLRAQPECAVYHDPCDLDEFLLEGRGGTRERILGDLFGLRELRHILTDLGAAAGPGTGKDELIQRILDAVGFRRLVLPEGIDSFLREVTVECRGLETERDRLRLLGIGTRVFLIAERALKDLVHCYGSWLRGPAYLDELRRRGWAPAHARSLHKLALGSLNQAFVGLAAEAAGRAEARKLFPGGAPLLPEPLVGRLHRLEPHRNRVFSHDSPDTRHLPAAELRTITLGVRDTIQDFFRHLRAAGVFPRKLVLDRKVEDRHGQVSYFCLSDLSDEVEVVTDAPLEPGQVYLCLSAGHPKCLHPVLVPEPAAG